MRRPHHLHAITLVLASAVTLGTTSCNKDEDEDDDEGAETESGDDDGDETDPSAGDDADPSAGDDADPSAGDDADPSTGDDADPSAGDDDPGESSDDGAESSGAAETGVGGELRISGTASRSEAAVPFAGNDGIGDLYVVVFDDACGGNVVGDGMAAAADLSDSASSVPFTIEGVGPGTYFLTGFLDDNGDYDPEAPGPNMGDIVMADGVMAGCIEVEVVDVDIEGAALLLNFTLPFDPP